MTPAEVALLSRFLRTFDMVGVLEADDRTISEDDLTALRQLIFRHSICPEPHRYEGGLLQFCSACHSGTVL